MANRSSLEIDVKEITFSKYFNQNNFSLFGSGDKSQADTVVSTPTKYQTLEIIIKEARFTKLTHKNETHSSSVVVIYGSQRNSTKQTRNDQKNPRWHETIQIQLGYQGSVFFPDTLEIMVVTRSVQTGQFDQIGKTVLSLREMLAETTQIDDWFCLVDQIQITGSICLSFRFLKAPLGLPPREERYSQSCYEQPQPLSPLLREQIQQKFQRFKRSDLQGKPIDEQLSLLSKLVQQYNDGYHHRQLDVKNENQKVHPKSHGSIVSKYLQNVKTKSIINEDYFSSPKPQTIKQKCAKISQLIEQVQSIRTQTQGNQNVIQTLNSQHLINNATINERSQYLQLLHADLQQSIQHKQHLKEQLIIVQIKQTKFPDNTKQRVRNYFSRQRKVRSILESLVQEKIADCIAQENSFSSDRKPNYDVVQYSDEDSSDWQTLDYHI